MKTIVCTIKVLFWVSTISAILTIPLSLYNDKCGSWGYQWGDAITVGVFASSLVVLISEFVRYKYLKSEIESDLYFNFSLLFLKLKTIVSEVDKYYKEPMTRLTSSFLRPQATEINDSNEKVRYGMIRYYPLQKNEVSKNAKAFALQTTPKLFNIISALRDVEIAVNEDILDVHKRNLDSFRSFRCGQIDNYVEQQPYITATSSHTNEALQKVMSLINDELFNSLESFLLAISKSNSNNFDWKKDKERILTLVHQGLNNHVYYKD